MNARRTPGRVLGNHAENEIAQFPADTLSSHTDSIPRKPSPIYLESGSVPADDGLRLNQDQHTLPSRPEPPQNHPERFLSSNQSRLGDASVSRLRVAAEEPGFPRAGRGESERIEQTGQPEA
jgi:hypothetical protein